MTNPAQGVCTQLSSIVIVMKYSILMYSYSLHFAMLSTFVGFRIIVVFPHGSLQRASGTFNLLPWLQSASATTTNQLPGFAKKPSLQLRIFHVQEVANRVIRVTPASSSVSLILMPQVPVPHFFVEECDSLQSPFVTKAPTSSASVFCNHMVRH